MKKKIFTAILTGAMLCGMLTTPVSAAEPEVRMGDVNFDGAVDIADAQLLLNDFAEVLVGKTGILTDVQREIGNVDGEFGTIPLYTFEENGVNPETGLTKWKKIELDPIITPITALDAQFVLIYYITNLVDATITMEEVVGKTEKSQQAHQAFIEKYKPVWNDETETYDFIEREG